MSDERRYIEGIGRRKTAVARVRLYAAGTLGGPTADAPVGFLINNRPLDEYFPMVAVRTPVRQPFDLTGTWGKFDVSVHVKGGGVHAQAGAVKLGIARALLKHDESLRFTLRATDLLTRDPREKERKKPGLKRARRAPQWQKR